jgi:hypothetical protein
MGRENRVGIYELLQDPELADLFKVALRSLALDLRTHTLCTVTNYNAATQRVSVEVDMRERVLDTSKTPSTADPNPTVLQEPIVLKDLPVAWPRTTAGYLTFPLAIGDRGELHVQDRALDRWLLAGQVAEPPRHWTHDLADSVFHPHVYHAGSTIAPPTDQTATVLEGVIVKIGRLAALAAARQTDSVGATVSMAAWITAVSTALSIATPASFGTITGGSTKVQVE